MPRLRFKEDRAVVLVIRGIINWVVSPTMLEYLYNIWLTMANVND